MELISMQSLTLLTTIIAIMSNLLSINEKIAKNGLVNTLKIMSYYAIPIIFIKQIIVFTHEAKTICTIFLSIIPILTLFTVKKKKIKFINDDDMTFIWMMFILAILLIYEIFEPCFGIENYSSQITSYIKGLKDFKISIDMYRYMLENLLCTLCLLIDAVKFVLFFIVSFNELVYYSYYIFNAKNNVIIDNLKENIDFRKMFINGFILFIISAFGKYIIHYVIGLF